MNIDSIVDYVKITTNHKLNFNLNKKVFNDNNDNGIGIGIGLSIED
jgi:hypothetical protein